MQHSKPAHYFAISTLVVGLGLFMCYFLIYYLYTGDAFYRFNSIMDNHYTHPESYFDKPFAHLLVRLTYAPWQMFTESGLLVAVLPGLLMAARVIIREKINLRSRENFWSWFAVIFLLCFYFGTTSLRYYNPLNLLPRMYFPLLPPFVLLAGLFWVSTEHTSRASIVMFLLFGIATLYCMWIHSKYTLIYVAYALVALWPIMFRFRFSIRTMRIFFVIVGLAIPIYQMLYPQQWGYQAEKKFFEVYLNQSSGNNLVITDKRLALTFRWFYQFQPPDNYHFIDFTKAHKLPEKDYNRVFVLFNPHTFHQSFGSLQEWDQWVQYYKYQLKVIAVSDEVVL